MDEDQSMEEIRYDLDKPRIAPMQEYLETSSQYSVLVQFKSSHRRKDLQNLSNTIVHLQHTACDLSWENGMHGD